MQTLLLSALLAATFFPAELSTAGEDSIEEELIALCGRWLDDYSQGRADRVEALFAPGAVVAIDAVDSDTQRVMSAAEFMAIVRKSLDEAKTFREWLVGEPTVLVDHKVATVWAPYLVESPGRRAGGIDVFQFIEVDGAWKIVSLSYTNRKVAARAASPVELGRVRWSGDLDASIEKARATGKPVLLLFQEIPG